MGGDFRNIWQSSVFPNCKIMVKNVTFVGFMGVIAPIAPPLRGAPSMSSLTGLDAPFTCIPSWQTPSPRNSWRMGHIGPGIASLPGSSTSNCSTYGRSQQLKDTVSLIFFMPEEPPAALRRLRQGKSGSGFHLPGVYTPRGAGAQILVLRFPHFLHAPTPKFQRSGE